MFGFLTAAKQYLINLVNIWRMKLGIFFFLKNFSWPQLQNEVTIHFLQIMIFLSYSQCFEQGMRSNLFYYKTDPIELCQQMGSISSWGLYHHLSSTPNNSIHWSPRTHCQSFSVPLLMSWVQIRLCPVSWCLEPILVGLLLSYPRETKECWTDLLYCVNQSRQ